MSDDAYSDDDQNPSDATLLWAKEANEKFKKEFPLRKETVEQREKIKRRMYTPAFCKKLNFDETMSPIAMEVDAAKASLNTTQRKLTMATNEVQKLKDAAEEKDKTLHKLMAEKFEMRQKCADLEAEIKQIQRDYEFNKKKDSIKLENWISLGRKYYIWHNMANSQLEAIKDHVNKNGKWDNQEEVANINTAATNCFKIIKDLQFPDEYVEQLAAGSIQSFSGVEFDVRPPTDETSQVLECVRGSASNISVFEAKPTVSEMTILNNTDVNSTIREDLTMMTDGGPLNISSIDYEKDEKIQRLLLENSVLKDKMATSRGRVERSMMIEETNRSLEVEKQSLKERLDRTFSEIEAMRMGHARRYFDNEDNSQPMDNSAKQLKLIDRITHLLAENMKLEKDFESATSRIMKISKDLKECERRNDNLEDAYSKQVNECLRLKKEVSECSTQIELQNAELNSLKEQLVKKDVDFDLVNMKLKEAMQLPPPASVVTDAGNTTQIFHMATNPLEAAHAEYQAIENRKRKIDDVSSSDDNEAKRRKDELIEELEEKLTNCEREKNVIEDGYKLQRDLASKFRQVCVALTGLQIKLKDADEGICTVQSEYEGISERQFVFKCFYGTTRIDMLDVNGEESSDMLAKWEPIMKKYIGERNSIPAFLAAVTLQLEKEREFDETMHERTHTFSVLQED